MKRRKQRPEVGERRDREHVHERAPPPPPPPHPVGAAEDPESQHQDAEDRDPALDHRRALDAALVGEQHARGRLPVERLHDLVDRVADHRAQVADRPRRGEHQPRGRQHSDRRADRPRRAAAAERLPVQHRDRDQQHDERVCGDVMGRDHGRRDQHDHRRPAPPRLGVGRLPPACDREQRHRRERQRERLVAELRVEEEERRRRRVHERSDAGGPGRAAHALEEGVDREHDHHAGRADQDQSGRERRYARHPHDRGGGRLDPGVARRDRQDRVGAEEPARREDRLQVVEVHELVGVGEREGVLKDLQRVQREPVDDEDRRALAAPRALAGHAQRGGDRHQRDRDPEELVAATVPAPRERVGDRDDRDARGAGERDVGERAEPRASRGGRGLGLRSRPRGLARRRLHGGGAEAGPQAAREPSRISRARA